MIWPDHLRKKVVLDQPFFTRLSHLDYLDHLQKMPFSTVLFATVQMMKIICKKCCTEPSRRSSSFAKNTRDSWYSISWVASIGCAELKDRFFRFRILYWGAPKFFRWFCIEVRQPGSLAPHVLSRWKVLAGKCSAFLFNRSPSIDRDVCWGDGLAINIFLKQRLHQALW